MSILVDITSHALVRWTLVSVTGRARSQARRLVLASLEIMLKLNGSRQRRLVLVGLELNGRQVAAVPFRLVADERRIEYARLNAQIGHIRGTQRPLGKELDRLGLGQLDDERRLDGSRSNEAVVLEGDDGPRVQAESARVLVEVAQNVARVEELNHGDARRHVDRVHVVAVNERVERLAD